MHNDYLLIQAPQQLRFYQVKSIEKYVQAQYYDSQEFMTFSIRASSQSAIFERKLFSVVDIFTQIGGIKSTLMLAGLAFCAAFQ